MLTFLAGDYDLSGVVDNTDYTVWKTHFGEIGESPIDGNGNGVVDSGDYTVWRDNLGKATNDLPPDVPQGIWAAATGTTSIEVTWQASARATSYSVLRRQPDTEGGFSSIASNIVGTSFTDMGLLADTLYEYRIIAQSILGISLQTQIVQATTGRSNLTAFRPQSVQDPEAPVDQPIYDTFVRRPVREQDEFNGALGPGIRINFDDDDNDGTADALQSNVEIPQENDLIEVRVDRVPGQGDLLLRRTGALSLYYTHDKETPIPLDANLIYSEPLPFVNDTITVFVEWAASQHGTDTLSLVDAVGLSAVDSIRFHTFRSLIIVFGGDTQNPRDTDGDGSIGDPIGDSTTNREGIFDLAQGLYDTGWDVLAFDEEAVDDAEDIPFTEARKSIQRLVSFEFGGGVSIMGYSQGGGATHDLIERLRQDDENFNTIYGVFLDAVDHDSLFAENDWPNVTFYLLSFYETNSSLNGGAIDDDHLEFPGTTVEEINTTTATGWDHSLDHFLIDDSLQVHQRILQRLNQLHFR